MTALSGYVVLDLVNLGIPMKLYDYDGNRSAPPGGILLDCRPEEDGHRDYTVFPTYDKAEAAVRRSVEHGRAQGYTDRAWQGEAHLIVPRARLAAARKDIRKQSHAGPAE